MEWNEDYTCADAIIKTHLLNLIDLVKIDKLITSDPKEVQ